MKFDGPVIKDPHTCGDRYLASILKYLDGHPQRTQNILRADILILDVGMLQTPHLNQFEGSGKEMSLYLNDSEMTYKGVHWEGNWKCGNPPGLYDAIWRSTSVWGYTRREVIQKGLGDISFTCDEFGDPLICQKKILIFEKARDMSKEHHLLHAHSWLSENKVIRVCTNMVNDKSRWNAQMDLSFPTMTIGPIYNQYNQSLYSMDMRMCLNSYHREKKWLVSFQGSGRSILEGYLLTNESKNNRIESLRMQMKDIFSKEKYVEKRIFFKVNDFNTYDAYWKLLKQSHFCFAIAGHSPYSFRFMEILPSGCIPIVIAHGLVLPFHRLIPWDDHLILRVPEIYANGWTNESKIDSFIDNLIKMSKDSIKMCQMSINLIKLHKRHFKTYPVIIQSFFNEIRLLLNQ